MNPRRLLGWALRRRLGLITVAVAGMAGGILLVHSSLAPRPVAPGAGAPDLLRDPPIAAEADVFRLRPADLAVDVDGAPRTGARLRTLAGFRELRAYPGAPPRVPHSLSAEEFRATTCNACHEAGGYSARFGAYAPVTPHPEYRNCLQCHVADDGAVGVEPPARLIAAEAADSRPARPAAPELVPLDWQTASWPAIGRRGLRGGPPTIPHSLELRGNCLACHAGPSAVAEVRTTHPERANCRQCHVPSTYRMDDDVFTRPAAAGSGGGAP